MRTEISMRRRRVDKVIRAAEVAYGEQKTERAAANVVPAKEFDAEPHGEFGTDEELQKECSPPHCKEKSTDSEESGR